MNLTSQTNRDDSSSLESGAPAVAAQMGCCADQVKSPLNAGSAGGRLFSAVGQPVSVRPTSTDSASRTEAASSFDGKISVEEQSGLRLRVNSPTDAPMCRGSSSATRLQAMTRGNSRAATFFLSWFQRLRKAAVAPVLAGRIKPAGPHNDERQRVSGFDSVGLPSQSPAIRGRTGLFQVGPRPAFFLCPHHARSHRHAVNCRGLRLLWLLHWNGGLR